jgi:hypothetical protein
MQNISTSAMFAEPTLAIPMSRTSEAESTRQFTLDTTFVLFFLAMDLGGSALSWSLGLSLLTLAAFIVLPYFLPFSGDKERFGKWLVGRIIVAAVGATFGLMLGQAVGTVLPEVFRFVPMTLLIVAAIVCCNVQIYGILKHRLAR